MSELDHRAHDLELPAHGPGRALGQKRKPQLRLALGYRDETRRGAPVKTDFFIPQGDDRAVTKFMREYGDRPRAVNIRLPGSLVGFLDIHHIAFAGGSGEGGYLRARGAANFAATGVLGGPDVLTVYEKVDTPEGATTLAVKEVPIRNVYDDEAVRLDVYLRMVVTFGIPDVLGLGGICEVSTRSRESIDTLWQQAADIYGQLGSYAMVSLNPKLVLKPSTMLTPLGTRAPLYVLDLWMPETWDEVYSRLERHHALVPERGATARALLYGEGELGEEPPAEAGRPDKPETPTSRVAVPVSRPFSDEAPSSPEPPEEPPQDIVWTVDPEPEPDWLDADAGEPGLFTTPESAVAAAGATTMPSGKHRGLALVDIALLPDGIGYLKWVARDWKDEDVRDAARLFCEGLP